MTGQFSEQDTERQIAEAIKEYEAKNWRTDNLLLGLTEPWEKLTLKDEEWIGDAFLTAAGRIAIIKHDFKIKTHTLSYYLSNKNLNNYASYLGIEGGADEIERRFARCYFKYGLEKTIEEFEKLKNASDFWVYNHD
jgi:hypothetical protein